MADQQAARAGDFAAGGIQASGEATQQRGFFTAVGGDHAKPVAGLAQESRLPAVYPNRFFVKSGGLMYCGVNFSEIGQALARQADLILKGAGPQRNTLPALDEAGDGG